MPFGVAPAGDIFQKKIEKLYHGLPNVFSMADDTLTAGFDEIGRYYDATLDKVLRICRQANLKLKRISTFLGVPTFLSFEDIRL